jgi:O-antigen/teichoic acid export membrane protein
MLRRYKRFPLYDSWATLLNTGSRDFPLLILGIYFTPAVVGLYSVAWRIMSMPVAIVSRNVMRVFLPEAKDGHAEGRLDESLVRLFRQMLGFSMTPLLLGVIAAPELVKIILGSNWVGAAIYIQWLSVFILLLFVEMPLMQTLTILEKVRQRLIYQILLAGARLGGLVVGGMLGDPVLAIALASVLGSAIVFAAIIVVLGYAGVRPGTTLGVFATEILRSLPYGVALLAIKIFTGSDIAVFVGFFACGSIFAWLRLRGMMRAAT